MKAEITTQHFEFAHGKKPRGYGMWAFYFVNEFGEQTLLFAPNSMYYLEAKTWAKDKARELNGVIEIYVAP